MTWLSLVGLIVVSLAVFLFVLEPILRARRDVALLDAAALPRHEASEEPDDAPADPSLPADDDSSASVESASLAARRMRGDAV